MTEQKQKTEAQIQPEEKLVRLFGVRVDVMQETLALLQNELPMAKARAVVMALEQSPVINVPGK